VKLKTAKGNMRLGERPLKPVQTFDAEKDPFARLRKLKNTKRNRVGLTPGLRDKLTDILDSKVVFLKLNQGLDDRTPDPRQIKLNTAASLRAMPHTRSKSDLPLSSHRPSVASTQAS